MIGSTLNKRYFIVSLLGTGEHGQTYLAEDNQTKENSRCVIKEFEPKAKDTISLRKAKYLFAREAKILKLLGKSDRIPDLLAYFQEDDKFYLVNQLIEGTDLTQELGSGKQWTAEQVIGLLREILEIVEVAHHEKVIHQDIKPSNIIRRQADSKLMLIDFGSVKKLNNQMANADGKTELTVPIGTEGYMSPEQKSIKPRLASDIYGIGMIGIFALTGIEPKDIPLENNTETVQWKKWSQVDEKLAQVLDRMVFPDFRQRYTSATEALKVVRNLKLSKKIKLLDFKTIVGAGVLLLGISGAGYYYWQLESSLSRIPDATGYYETEKEQFPFMFRNAQYGIEMKYPFDWKLNEPKQSENIIAQLVPENNQSDSIPPEVQIQVTASNNALLDQYTTDTVFQITKLPQAKIIDSRPIKFARGDGHKVIYTAANPDNQMELKYLQVWILKGDRVYTVIYKADLEQYDNYAGIVEDEMLESLKIIPTS
jgi:eukaryotic-like serine/threonine-protein kinase